MEKMERIARQVWLEFTPGPGEELACRDDGIFEVTIDGATEGFNIDNDVPDSVFASNLADRIQTVIIEGRQKIVPDCPLHSTVHPLRSTVVGGTAAWVCPSTMSLVRYMAIADKE